MKRTFALLTALLLAPLATLNAAGPTQPRYAPDWADIAPKRVIKHIASDAETLVKAVAALVPGDQLVIAAGTYSAERMWDIGVSGTAEAPIWIVAEKGAKVTFTRPDAKQNVLNIRVPPISWTGRAQSPKKGQRPCHEETTHTSSDRNA